MVADEYESITVGEHFMLDSEGQWWKRVYVEGDLGADEIRGDDVSSLPSDVVAFATWVAIAGATCFGFAFGLLVAKLGPWL
jgi:hypothetical protein